MCDLRQRFCTRPDLSIVAAEVTKRDRVHQREGHAEWVAEPGREVERFGGTLLSLIRKAGHPECPRHLASRWHHQGLTHRQVSRDVPIVDGNRLFEMLAREAELAAPQAGRTQGAKR